jgi:hypothetical protein
VDWTDVIVCVALAVAALARLLYLLTEERPCRNDSSGPSPSK